MTRNRHSQLAFTLLLASAAIGLSSTAARAEADEEPTLAEQIAALNLPSFEGKTTLEGDAAGEMEANMLAMQAMRAAAVQIKRDLSGVDCTKRRGESGREGPCFLVLAGNEQADFSQIGSIQAEMEAIETLYLRAGVKAGPGTGFESVKGAPFALESLGGAVAIANAIAGLLRSETTISAASVTAIDEPALATEVAGELGALAALPGAAVGPTDRNWPMLRRFDKLAQLRTRADEMLAAERSRKKPDAAAIKRVEAANARYDRFFETVTDPGTAGVVPILRAARLESLLAANPYILRIHVQKAGGSLINRSNIGTFFGADPLRVTGGLIARYSATDPNSGTVAYKKILVCRTGLSRLGPIHDAAWKGRAKPIRPDCSEPTA